MDQLEAIQAKQIDETVSVVIPINKVGGQRPPTLSTGDGTPETRPLGPGQRWGLARKSAHLHSKVENCVTI